MSSDHSTTLATLAGQLQSQKEQQLRDLATLHDRELTALRADHATQLEDLRKAKDKELKRLRDDFDK
jgi:hypothetical protein